MRELPKIISVDDHVVEPAHVWQTWLPEKWRERGPRSRHFEGNHVCQTWGGSTTWSSTLMIFGSSRIEGSPTSFRET